MRTSAINTDLARLFQGFFCQRLIQQRHASPRTVSGYRDAFRLLLRFAENHTGKPIDQLSVEEPTALPGIQQVLAIPMKRFDQPLVGFLSRAEVEAILQAPGNHTWSGQRDRALLTTLYNTGARVSEIIAVRRVYLEREHGQALHLHGKGRKERVVPLWKRTARMLREWLPRIGPEPQ